MKLGTCVILGAAGFGSLLVATTLSVEGCSSSTTSNSSGDGGATGTGALVGQPPASPAGASATTSTTAHNFAMQKLHMGDEEMPEGSGWMKYGYNLDGLVTSGGVAPNPAASTNVCTLVGSAAKKTQQDGPNGIDNSFGENILGLLVQVSPNPSATIDTSITAGKFTLMLDVVGLDTTSTQSATGLSGQIFSGVHFNQGPNSATSVPTFTTADNWPLDKNSVMSGIGTDANQTLVQPVVSTVVFTSAYIANGTFVNGGRSTVTLGLTISGVPLTLTMYNSIVTFNHSATGAATGGMIGGVLKTTDLVSTISGVAGSISTSFCSGAALQTVVTAIQQASDIMVDGTNASGETCDGISIGLGFDAIEIGPPLVAGDPTMGSNPCGDAGTVTPDDAGTTADSGSVVDSGTVVDSGSADATGE